VKVKLSRDEIVRALNICVSDDIGQCVKQNCPYLGGDPDDTEHVCVHTLLVAVADVVKHSEPIVNAVWVYYSNDEGKARWRCGNCGKICRRDPHDKARCSRCGAHMAKEA
jgi:hypothetical protein